MLNLIFRLVKAWLRLRITNIRIRSGLSIDMQVKMVMYVRADGSGDLHCYHVHGAHQTLAFSQELDAEAVKILRDTKEMEWK